MTLTAAILGLGQVAWRFDEEPERKTIWTHLGAYRASGEFGRIVAYDPDSSVRGHFSKRHPDVALCESLEELMATGPDVVSLCSPNHTHADALAQLLKFGAPKAIWCEKPLATEYEDGRAMVDACARSNIPLVVSHVRRWAPLWRRLKDHIDAGTVGKLRSVRIAMPNRLWSVGSHAVDLLLWLGGPVSVVSELDIPALEEDGEPARAALVAFTTGATGMLQVTGMKDRLLVEADVIGDAGRLMLDEGRGTIVRQRFAVSPRFAGYQELDEPTVERPESPADFSPFVSIAQEVAAAARDGSTPLTCSGADALETQRLLSRLASTAPPITNMRQITP